MSAFFLDFPSDWIVHKPQQTIRNSSRGKDLLPGPPPAYRYPSTVNNNGAAVVSSSPRNRPATAANSTSTNHSRSARNFHDDKKNLSSSSDRAPLCRLSQTKDVPSLFVGKPPPTSQQHTPIVRDVSTAQQPAPPEDFASLPQRQQHQQVFSSPRHPSALPREQRLAQRHRWRLPLRTERARPSSSSIYSSSSSTNARNVVHAEAISSAVTGGATTPTTTGDASLIYRDVYYAALDCLWHLLSLDHSHGTTEGGDGGNGTGNSNNTQSSSRSALQWLTTLVDTEVVPLLHHCCCWSEPSSSRPPRTTTITTTTILPATARLTSSIHALFLVREAVHTVRQLRSAAAVQQPELLFLPRTATQNSLSLIIEEALLELDRQIAAALRRGGGVTAGKPDAALCATSASSTTTAVESLDGFFALCFRRHAAEAPELRQKYLPKSTALLRQFHVDYQQQDYPPSEVAHGDDEKKASQRRGSIANVEENTAAEPPPSTSTPIRPPPAATATPTRPQSAPNHRAYLAFRRPSSASTSANTSAAANSYASKERKKYLSRELVVCRTMESALHEDDHLAQTLRQSVLRCVASLRCTATSCSHCGGVFRQIGLGLVAQGRSSVQQQQHGASHHVSAEMFVLFLLLQFSQRWSVLNSSSSTGRPSRCVVTESQADEEAMEIVRDQFLRLHPVVVASEGSWWPSHVAVGIQLKWFGRMRSGGGQPPPHQGSNSSQQQQRSWLAMERRRVHPDRLQNAIGVVAQQIRQALGKRILQHGGGVGVKNNTTRSSPSSCVGCLDLLQTSPEAATLGEGTTTSVFSSSSVNQPVPLEVLLQVLEGPLREAILAVATEVSQRINSAL